jgi:AraC-like DNA-binding protein
MKPTLRKAVPQAESSFIVRKDIGTKMKNNWHYHPDFELLFIKRSMGTWLVGDYVGPFKSGDVILIGPDLPHSFRHDYAYVMERDKRPGEAIVILFPREIFGKEFFDIPEIKEIRDMLALSAKGLKLADETKMKVSRIMSMMPEENPAKRFFDLLYIFQLIADKKQYEILASEGFSYQSDGIDNARLSAIFEYTFNNYQNQITIDDVAALINVGKHTFCRYFKEKTNKTYIQFLMELRIGKACKYLIEDNMNISEVCYSCGYNSLSHFNHQFKLVKNTTPHEYKHQYTYLSPEL